MRRKELIDKLHQISDISKQLGSIRDIPMLCRQGYGNRKKVLTEEPSQASVTPPGSFVVVGKHQFQQERPQTRNKSQSNTARRLVVRHKTTPSCIKPGTQQNKQQYSSESYPSQSELLVKKIVLTQAQNYSSVRKGGKIVTKRARDSIFSQKAVTPRMVEESETMVKRHSATQSCDFKEEKPAAKRVFCTSSLMLKQEVAQRGELKPFKSIKSTISGDKDSIDTLLKNALRKQIHLNYRTAFNAPPKITAKSYIIYESTSQPTVIASLNSKSYQEVASLTKIMTCILIIELSQGLKIDRNKQVITVGRMEESLGGTTAHIHSGDIYTVQQLLYGLMLPSGNDASVALAVWAGRKLLQGHQLAKHQPQRQNIRDRGSQSTVSCSREQTRRQGGSCTKSESYQRFLQQMNSKAKVLGMGRTNYANSHGLVNSNNKSSAYDIALLSSYAMKNSAFRHIVSTRQFQCHIFNNKSKQYQVLSQGECEEKMQEGNKESEEIEGLARTNGRKLLVEWENTHKLLHLRPRDYIGIKTGHTTVAGPCLASCVSAQGKQFIIVVLSCARMSLRFRETEVLRRWLYKHLGIKKDKKDSKLDQDVELDEANCESVLFEVQKG